MCPSPACDCQDREGHAARLKPRLGGPTDHDAILGKEAFTDSVS